MLSLSDDYWPYSYCSSEVYVHKRGSNVRYIISYSGTLLPRLYT